MPSAVAGPEIERLIQLLARFPGAKVVEVRKLAPEPPEPDSSGEDPPVGIDGDDD